MLGRPKAETQALANVFRLGAPAHLGGIMVSYASDAEPAQLPASRRRPLAELLRWLRGGWESGHYFGAVVRSLTHWMSLLLGTVMPWRKVVV